MLFRNCCSYSFYSCLKDEKVRGTHDCRWFPAIYLIQRIILFITGGYFHTGLGFSVSVLVLAFLILLQYLVQPYKPQYAHYGKVDLVFTFLLMMHFTFYCGLQISAISAHKYLVPFGIGIVTCTVIPATYYFIVIFIYWLIY